MQPNEGLSWRVYLKLWRGEGIFPSKNFDFRVMRGGKSFRSPVRRLVIIVTKSKFRNISSFSTNDRSKPMRYQVRNTILHFGYSHSLPGATGTCTLPPGTHTGPLTPLAWTSCGCNLRLSCRESTRTCLDQSKSVRRQYHQRASFRKHKQGHQ